MLTFTSIVFCAILAKRTTLSQENNNQDRSGTERFRQSAESPVAVCLTGLKDFSADGFCASDGVVRSFAEFLRKDGMKPAAGSVAMSRKTLPYCPEFWIRAL